MKLKSLLTGTCLVFAGLFISSCSDSAEARADCKIRVGIVFDIGGKNDRSFNAAAWEGVKRARQDLPICLYDVEPGNPTSIEPAMRAFAEKNFDLIIGVGFAQGPIMQKVAEDYPDIKFAIVDGVIFEKDGKTPKANVASLVFREHEGSYLVGMIAAAKSKTGILGFVGGMDIPLIHRFAKGYEEGALSVNPDAKFVVNYVGVTDSAWNNPGKGKELSLAQIEKGADVIFTAAGNSGLGAFDAVEQYGRDPKTGEPRKFVNSNQNGVKPGFVLTSMVKRVDNAVYDVVSELAPPAAVFVGVEKASVSEQGGTNVLASLPFGSEVEVLEVRDDRVRVNANGTIGWMERADLCFRSELERRMVSGRIPKETLRIGSDEHGLFFTGGSIMIKNGQPHIPEGTATYAANVDHLILGTTQLQMLPKSYKPLAEKPGPIFNGGFHVFGLDKDGVAYAMDEYNEGLIPPDVLQKVETAKQKIVAGEIVVTDAMAK